MPPHLISACAACAVDIRNARDRCEPIRGSRTVRRRAALSGSRTSEPAGSVEKKGFPMSKSSSDPFDRSHSGCGTRLGSSWGLRASPEAQNLMLLRTFGDPAGQQVSRWSRHSYPMI